MDLVKCELQGTGAASCYGSGFARLILYISFGNNQSSEDLLLVAFRDRSFGEWAPSEIRRSENGLSENGRSEIGCSEYGRCNTNFSGLYS
jgi:hypothetical protein